MRLLIAVGVLAAAATGCCKPKEIIEVPVRLSVPCELPLLSPRRAISFKGPDKGCPSPFAICLEVEDAAKLVAHLTDRRNWIEEAIAACGGDLLPVPPPEEDP